MSEMKIYVADLKAYNNGELKGDWFDLPADMDEIRETLFEKVDPNVDLKPIQHYAIHDYELPFEIEQYDNINVLNEMAEIIQNTNGYENIVSDSYNVSDAIEFARELGYADGFLDDFVSEDQMQESIREMIEAGEFQNVKASLAGIKDNSFDDNYFYQDDYDNFHSVTDEDLEALLGDSFVNLQNACKKNYSKQLDKAMDNGIEL